MDLKLKEKMKQKIDTAKWSYLKPHADRGGLLVVSPDLDLSEVGVLMAQDDVLKIESWLAQQKIERPSEGMLELLEKEPSRTFAFLIVQPYVLIQTKPN